MIFDLILNAAMTTFNFEKECQLWTDCQNVFSVYKHWIIEKDIKQSNYAYSILSFSQTTMNLDLYPWGKQA